MKSIFGKVAACARTERRAKILPPSGFGKARRPSKITGYHKQMKLSDLKLLADRLQREAVS